MSKFLAQTWNNEAEKMNEFLQSLPVKSTEPPAMSPDEEAWIQKLLDEA